MDKDNEREPCEKFTPHPIRKYCIDCLKPIADHPFTEDDVDDMRTHLRVFPEQLKLQQHTEFAWIPPNCPENRIDEYFQKFPEDKVPRHKSEGQKYRLRQLTRQIPLSDISADKCRFLDFKYREEFEEYAQKVQGTILRVGKVREWTHGMPIQCPKCLLIVDEDELVVRTSENEGPVFHPTCFTCVECGELLADLIHCSDVEGKVHCLRHFSDSVKKRCHACDELIFENQFAKAGNKFYHKEHLLCFSCDVLMESSKGYIKNGEIYCSTCYEAQFCNECAKCQKRISVDSRHVSFRDKNLHDACFTCNKCDIKLSDISFEVVDEEIFLCTGCYQKDYAPKCEGCNESLESQSKIVNYEEKIYHVSCFKCVDCQSSIGTNPFVPHKGRVYCKSCHLRNFGVRCFRCKYAITDDRGLMYNKEPYHEACFTCFKCVTNISNRPFKTVEDKWYCFNCYTNTFCQRCHVCEDPIALGTEEEIMFSYKDYRWHDSCFVCTLCCTSLDEKPFIMSENVLVCKQCVTERDEEKEKTEKEDNEEKEEKEKEEEEKQIPSAGKKDAEMETVLS